MVEGGGKLQISSSGCVTWGGRHSDIRSSRQGTQMYHATAGAETCKASALAKKQYAVSKIAIPADVCQGLAPGCAE